MIHVLPSNNSNLVYADWLEEYENDIVKAVAVRAGLYINQSELDFGKIDQNGGYGSGSGFGRSIINGGYGYGDGDGDGSGSGYSHGVGYGSSGRCRADSSIIGYP